MLLTRHLLRNPFEPNGFGGSKQQALFAVPFTAYAIEDLGWIEHEVNGIRGQQFHDFDRHHGHSSRANYIELAHRFHSMFFPANNIAGHCGVRAVVVPERVGSEFWYVTESLQDIAFLAQAIDVSGRL